MNKGEPVEAIATRSGLDRRRAERALNPKGSKASPATEAAAASRPTATPKAAASSAPKSTKKH